MKQNIWYHITTIENWKLIQNTGYIDPIKTVVIENTNIVGTIVFKDKKEANEIIKFPTWIIRDTLGYILLTIDCKNDTLDENGKSVTNTETGQARVNSKIFLNQIIKNELITTIDATKLETFKYDDLLIGFVKVNFKFKYDTDKQYVIYCRWSDAKDHFDKLPATFSKNLLHYIDAMQLSKSEYIDAINELTKLKFKKYYNKILLPFVSDTNEMKHLLNKEELFKILESFNVSKNDIIWIHHPITEDLIQVNIIKTQADKVLVGVMENSPYFGQPEWWMNKINIIGLNHQ